MKKALKQKLESLKLFLLDRMGEASTWQGLGFILSLFGSHWGADLDWGAAAALGGTVSGLIKVIFPDKKADKDTPDDTQ